MLCCFSSLKCLKTYTTSLYHSDKKNDYNHAVPWSRKNHSCIALYCLGLLCCTTSAVFRTLIILLNIRSVSDARVNWIPSYGFCEQISNLSEYKTRDANKSLCSTFRRDKTNFTLPHSCWILNSYNHHYNEGHWSDFPPKLAIIDIKYITLHNLISSIETLHLMVRYIVLVPVVWTIQSIQHWKLIVMLNWHFQQTFDFCFVLLKFSSSLIAPTTKLILLSHHFSRPAPLKLMQQDYGSVPSVNIMFCKITNSRANTGGSQEKYNSV